MDVAGLIEQTQKGDKLSMYKCLIVGIAHQLEQTDSGRDVAALSKQYVDLSERIEELESAASKQERRTPLDEILSRRGKPPKKA